MANLKVHIALAAGAASASAVFEPKKYNKTGSFHFQFDDGSHGVLVAHTNLAAYTYTDGCGNPIKYAGSVGMNRGTGVSGSDYYDAQVLQNADFQPLIADGWDIENHSYFHAGTNIPNLPIPDSVKTQALLDAVLEDDAIYNYVKYRMRGFIIPTNFSGYADACAALGYLSVTSEGFSVFDEFTPIVDFLPGQYPNPPLYPLVRDYNDDWSTLSTQSTMRTGVDKLTADPHMIDYYIFFTHSGLETPTKLANYMALFDYLRTQANDKILVCTVREAAEYEEMKSMPFTQSFTDGILTLTVNTDNLSDRNRFKDCCFNVTSDQAISGVTVEGFDSATFNPATGLVNAFLQQTAWGATVNPGPVPDPVQSLLTKRGNFIAA